MTRKETAEILIALGEALRSGWSLESPDGRGLTLLSPRDHPCRNWAALWRTIRFADGTQVSYPDNLKDMLRAKPAKGEK